MVTEAFAYMRQHADYTMTTHGGIGVDCQILQLAALTADLALPRQLAEAQGPRWKDVRHLDIGLAFKASGKTWHHLSELLLRMGLPAALLLGKADPGVRPEKIDWHKIQEHCELDVLFTSIVLLGWLRLQGHSFLRLATGQLALIESFLRQRPLAVSAPLLRAHADDLQRAVAQELAA